MPFATPAWDLALFNALHFGLRGIVLDVLMPLVSSPLLLWAVVGGGLVLGLRHVSWQRRAVVLIALLATLGLTDGGTNIVKHSVGRVRPLNALAGVHYHEDGAWQQRPADYVQTKERGNSYPSAHAASSMAVACLLAFFWPRVRRSIWLLPLVVGFSRVYLAKHYPLDVGMGWLFGIGAALATCAVLLALGHGAPVGADPPHGETSPEDGAAPGA